MLGAIRFISFVRSQSSTALDVCVTVQVKIVLFTSYLTELHSWFYVITVVHLY